LLLSSSLSPLTCFIGYMTYFVFHLLLPFQQMLKVNLTVKSVLHHRYSADKPPLCWYSFTSSLILCVIVYVKVKRYDKLEYLDEKYVQCIALEVLE